MFPSTLFFTCLEVSYFSASLWWYCEWEVSSRMWLPWESKQNRNKKLHALLQPQLLLWGPPNLLCLEKIQKAMLMLVSSHRQGLNVQGYLIRARPEQLPWGEAEMLQTQWIQKRKKADNQLLWERMTQPLLSSKETRKKLMQTKLMRTQGAKQEQDCCLQNQAEQQFAKVQCQIDQGPDHSTNFRNFPE